MYKNSNRRKCQFSFDFINKDTNTTTTISTTEEEKQEVNEDDLSR